MHFRRYGLSCLMSLGVIGCDEGAERPGEAAVAPTALPVHEAPQPPSEFSGTTLRIPVDGRTFTVEFGPVFEAAATDGQAGEATLVPGLRLRAGPDPRTEAQVLLAVELVPVSVNEGEALPLAEVAGTRAYAELFVEAASQALAVHDAEVAAGRPVSRWGVGWKLRSANGGRILIEVQGEGTEATLVVTVDTPRLALSPGRENEAAFVGEARETVTGYVPFALDYASFRTGILGVLGGGGAEVAGGCEADGFAGATAPHTWYRLCFTGHPELVDAGQAVVDLGARDGRVIGLARAPGSVRSVGLWVATLDRLIANAQAGVGADTPVRSVYDYRDPDGNGTSVIEATIGGGEVRFFHQFETPPSVLQDVAFLPAPDLRAPAEAPTPCAAVGGVPADEGIYVVRFRIGASLRQFAGLTLPLEGNVHLGLYREADLGLAGPLPGAEPLQSHRLDGVTVGVDASDAVLETDPLPAGRYKLTAFLDLDADADQDPSPEPGEPVVLPLQATPLTCSRQPAIVEFGLLYPER